MKKINWGIIGCAGIAYERTVPGLLMAKNANLYAVASRNGEKTQKFIDKFSPDVAYSSYEELLNDENVDAVYIPLPNTMHCEWVLKAADKGKHILCEKPLAMNAQEAEKMYKYCEDKGVILMEAFAYRHAPLVHKAKEIAQSGEIGKVKFIESHLTFALYDQENIRLSESLGGGAHYDVGCYNISLISYIMGKTPTKIVSVAEMANEVVDVSNSSILFFDEGEQAFAYSALNCYAKGGYTIVGEKGRIEVPDNFNCRHMSTLNVYTGGVPSNVELSGEIVTTHKIFCPDNYMLEIEQMGRCITDAESPLVSKEETIANIKIMDELIAQR